MLQLKKTLKRSVAAYIKNKTITKEHNVYENGFWCFYSPE